MMAEHRVAWPGAMAELVERLVAADPDDRPASPQEVAGALEPFADAGAVEAALARAGAVATLAVIGSIVVVAGRDEEGVSNDTVGSSTPATSTTTAEVTVASAPRVTVALPPRASFDRRARVAISPDATTAGEGISRIVITYGAS